MPSKLHLYFSNIRESRESLPPTSYQYTVLFSSPFILISLNLSLSVKEMYHDTSPTVPFPSPSSPRTRLYIFLSFPSLHLYTSVRFFFNFAFVLFVIFLFFLYTRSSILSFSGVYIYLRLEVSRKVFALIKCRSGTSV